MTQIRCRSPCLGVPNKPQTQGVPIPGSPIRPPRVVDLHIREQFSRLQGVSN